MKGTIIDHDLTRNVFPDLRCLDGGTAGSSLDADTRQILAVNGLPSVGWRHSAGDHRMNWPCRTCRLRVFPADQVSETPETAGTR